ncbi:MAG: adenosine deaminase [Coriobacteriia bacterium]|nr:adenosine deaminase [Coriobacteriia bacterium]
MTWYDGIPKVELHVHMEGAIPHEALFALIQKYGGDPSVPDVAALAQRFQYSDFPHFIETWLWKNQYLREYDDFTLIAELVARDMAAQNIRYAEVFYSPVPFESIGLSVQGVTQAIRTGLAKVSEIEIALVADLVRDMGPVSGLSALEALAEVRDLGVIGIGIGGSEQAFPPRPFRPVYELARELGFHTTAHAGEAAGPNSIWDALLELGAERIGHGTRAREDSDLVTYLAKNRIPLEMCPVSNVRTGVCADLRSHPIREYFDAGVLVTLNSDDPKMFQTSLADEYRQLEEACGWTRSELRRLSLNAVEASWLPVERRASLSAEFQSWSGWSK